MLSLCEPCLTRSLAPSLSLSHPHTHTQIPTETCHPQQKPPKLILTRSCPAHQRTTHTIGIIDQSLTFWWKQEEKKSIRVIHFFFLFVLSAADIPQQLHVSLTHNIMLGQQKSVIVCAVMAKGKRANMQDIYHPRRYMRVCVCESMCGRRGTKDFACARMSATETMYNTIALTLTLSHAHTHGHTHAHKRAHSCTHPPGPAPANMTICKLTFRYEQINGWNK